MVVSGEVTTLQGVMQTEALLDTSAEVNVISQYFVIEHQLQRIEGDLPQPQFINGQRAYCYGVYRVKYRLTDSWGQSWDCKHTFYALEKTGPPLILGLPALKAEHVQIDCGTKTWQFNIDNTPLEIQTPKDFAQGIQDAPIVYVILWTGPTDDVVPVVPV